MSAGKVLIVCTSHDKLQDGTTPAGLWLEELATPYYIFREKGLRVDIASIKGGKIPLNPTSTDPKSKFLTSEASAFLKDKDAMRQLENSSSAADILSAADIKQYDALFIPGGHGIVFDGPSSQELKTIVETMWNNNKIIASVCHGPAALVNVKTEDGKPLVAGRRICAFTDSAEKAAGKDKNVPFLLESRIKELGGKFECATEGDWNQPHAVQDIEEEGESKGEGPVMRRHVLITGQNPASSREVATMVCEAIFPSLHPGDDDDIKGKGEGEGFHARGHPHARPEHHEHREGERFGARSDVSDHPQAHKSQWHQPVRQHL
jgi:putative intracellular protease/amidase